MQGGSGEKRDFSGLVFIETEANLGVDLNTGSCVEETVTTLDSKKPAEKQNTQNLSSYLYFLLLLIIIMP